MSAQKSKSEAFGTPEQMNYVPRLNEALARVTELEAALHAIAAKTYSAQWENSHAPWVNMAGGLHDTARRALEGLPPRDES